MIAVAVLVAWDGRPLAPAPHDYPRLFHLWLWIGSQALCLTFCPLAMLLACAAFTDKTNWIRFCAAWVNVYFVVFPMVVFLDGLVFQWIGQRLFSSHFTKGTREITRLIPFMTSGSLGLATWAAAVGVGTCIIGWRLSNWLSKVTLGRTRALMAMVALMYAFALVSGALYFLEPNAKLTKTMEFRSAAHPFYVFGVLRTKTVGPNPKPEAQQPSELSNPATTVDKSHEQISSSFLARERRLRFAQPIPTRQLESLPDIVVVVIESLRAELVSREVMPNLSRLAEEGIHCRYHFSGGNATNHGVFSLVTGLEPIWFGTSQRFDPCMLRWFNSLGYKTGFFAGADDWDEFRMDGFIRPQLFDQYEVMPRDGIASDRRAVELASAFLSGRDDNFELQIEREPRFAVVYLYGTHATYQSYAKDQIDQPAADNRFPFPYPAKIRDSVWNRYRNSARTVDRLVKPLLRRDNIVVAVGDHGEAFLEDGTVGHGTRLSRVQNMTAAVLYCAENSGRVIDHPTCHTDILPTILSFLKVDVSDPEAIDGISLTNATAEQLLARRFSVRNYLREEYGLIGPWTKESTKPFAYRFSASIKTESASPLNGIDEFGLESDVQNVREQAAEVTRWMSQFYRQTPQTQVK